jgi:ABC-type polysaccharide/polyol phosphate export permease
MGNNAVHVQLTKKNRWERIWLLAKIEFKLRYYENRLGLLWALLKPLIQLVIYFVAFKIVMRNNIENFAIYLFAGIVVWQFFMETTGGLINILRTKKYLYEYSNMSKIEIYLASLISASLGFGFNFLVLLFFLMTSGIGMGWNLIYFPMIFISLFVFCFGLALILSNLYLIVKDINQFWPLISQFLMWMSPIFLSFEALNNNIPFITYLNPMFGFISTFRDVVMYNNTPDFHVVLVNFVHAIFALVIGLLLLKVLGKRASELL